MIRIVLVVSVAKSVTANHFPTETIILCLQETTAVFGTEHIYFSE